MASQPAVLLTGCVQGVGLAVAEQLAARSCALALFDIDGPGLTQLADRLSSAHGIKVFARQVDITDPAAMASAVSLAIDQLGPFDAAINNAGGVASLVASGQLAGQFKPFHASDAADWRPIIDLNFYGALNFARAVLPGMIARRSGRVVFVSSVAGVVGAPGIAVYAATKGAVVALVKSLAREHARDGIIVNSVAPGGVATRAFPAGTDAATRRAERIPMGRLGAPEEIANAIVYLALEAPMYMSGEVLNVSGGPP